MKAIMSVQFVKYTRAMLVLEHSVSDDLAGLAKKIRKIEGVKDAVVIASHLQWVTLVAEGDDVATLIKKEVERMNTCRNPK